MQNDFTKAMDFRHACKAFDENKKINDEEMHYILETGQKSPSSFGMEAWKFLVITNEDLKAKLRPFCWDQVQVTSCSHLVIVLAGIENAKVESGMPKKRFTRREMPQETLDFYMDIYAKHLEKTLSSDENIYAWTAKNVRKNLMQVIPYPQLNTIIAETILFVKHFPATNPNIAQKN